MSHQQSYSFPSDDGISVIELGDFPAAPEVFAGVLGAYQEQGYERGYQRAEADMRTSLLALTEEYLRTLPGATQNVREALRGFEAFVQRHFRLRVRAEYMSDGLGI